MKILNFKIKTTGLLFSILLITMALLQHEAFSQKKEANKVVRIQTSAHTEQCKNKIEKTFAYEKGIAGAELDRESQILTVTYNPQKTNEGKIIKVINNLGHDAAKIPDAGKENDEGQ